MRLIASLIRYGGAITSQIRRLGASCDWSREKFTLQPELCVAVTEAFVTLHERGLIYKGTLIASLISPSLHERGLIYKGKQPHSSRLMASDGV